MSAGPTPEAVAEASRHLEERLTWSFDHGYPFHASADRHAIRTLLNFVALVLHQLAAANVSPRAGSPRARSRP